MRASSWALRSHHSRLILTRVIRAIQFLPCSRTFLMKSAMLRLMMGECFVPYKVVLVAVVNANVCVRRPESDDDSIIERTSASKTSRVPSPADAAGGCCR